MGDEVRGCCGVGQRRDEDGCAGYEHWPMRLGDAGAHFVFGLVLDDDEAWAWLSETSREMKSSEAMLRFGRDWYGTQQLGLN